MKDLPERNDRVFHQVFGEGTVTRIHKQSMGLEVEIQFDTPGIGKKSLIWAFAQSKIQIITEKDYVTCEYCNANISKQSIDSHECIGSLKNKINKLYQTIKNIQDAWKNNDSERLKNAIFEQGEINE